MVRMGRISGFIIEFTRSGLSVDCRVIREEEVREMRKASECNVLAGLAIGQFVPVLDLELTRDFRAPGNPPTHAELHWSHPKVRTELILELEASGPS